MSYPQGCYRGKDSADVWFVKGDGNKCHVKHAENVATICSGTVTQLDADSHLTPINFVGDCD